MSLPPIDTKTQTTKDLTKPWALLPLDSSSSPPEPYSNPPDTISSPDADQPEPQQTEQRQAHSAKTPLLLDDSSLKAHLQPYNHVCIREYVASLRGKDLEVFAGRKA